MDLQYLLALQQLREATSDVLTPFMEGVSDFAISFWPFAAVCFVYWAVDKKAGTYLLFTYASANLLNGFLKLTACVYRPWIRGAAIVPAGNAIATATGYSFPSGHSTTAAALYGGGAACLWKRRTWRIAAVLLIALMLLTMFSRNYLGVHTPQDVLVGCAVTLLLVYLNRPLLAWAEANVRNRDLAFVCIGLAILAALVVYITVKPYPLDYVDGALIVDPEKMKPDTFEAIGGTLGFLIGWLVERRFVKFEVTDRKRAAIVAVLALIPLFFWTTYFVGFAGDLMGLAAAKFAMRLVQFLCVLTAVPALIKATQLKTA